MSEPDELQRVANAYSLAAASGDRPFQAVTALGYTKATASRRIAEARASGLLDPLHVGPHGYVNVRALRVANALGVSYQQLVEVVRTHANGDLRIPMED